MPKPLALVGRARVASWTRGIMAENPPVGAAWLPRLNLFDDVRALFFLVGVGAT